MLKLSQYVANCRTHHPGESLDGAQVVPGEVLGEAAAASTAVAVGVGVQGLQVGRARLLYSVKDNLLLVIQRKPFIR